MPTQKKLVKGYITEEIYEKFKTIAKLEKRSVSNYIEYLATETVNNYESQHGTIDVGGGAQ